MIGRWMANVERRLLTYFLMVCEELHFTRAAERLGISQPTLSHQIALLEHQVGTPLFTRIGKRTYLSEAGQLLRAHALRAVHELDMAQAAIDELRGLKRGRLRIGCAGNHLLLSAIASFHARYPAIELSVQELATEETREGLLANRLDLGVVYLPLEDEQLRSVPLFDDELELAVKADHPLAGRASVPLGELREHPLALLQGKFLVRQFFDRYCEAEGFRVSPAVEMSTLESLLRMAEAGVGGAVLPRSYLETTSAPGPVRRIRLTGPAPKRTVGLVYRREERLRAAVSAFIAELSGAGGGSPGTDSV